MLCLAALALLCWPTRPAVLRSRIFLALGPGLGRLPGWPLAGWRRVGPPLGARSRWLLGALGVGALAIPAGLPAACAGLLVAGTVALLTSAELRRRTDNKQLATLLVATRTLAREVRTGASPVTAVLATAAAHPDCGAALDRVAVAVVGRRADAVRGPEPGAGRRVDQQANVVARLGDGWELSARHGVPWAALIDTVAIDLADRQRAQSLRNAQVAGPRVSGYVLAVMPALGILLGAGMGADPVDVLLNTGVGSVLLLVGSALTCLGLAWTAAIVRR